MWTTRGDHKIYPTTAEVPNWVMRVGRKVFDETERRNLDHRDSDSDVFAVSGAVAGADGPSPG